jgi:hypothetical protein
MSVPALVEALSGLWEMCETQQGFASGCGNPFPADFHQPRHFPQALRAREK